MYKVSAHKKAVKYYESLDDKTAKRINKAIESISNNPLEGPHIKRLRGIYEGKYRYAVGDLRIVYRVNEEEKIILIEAIGPRGGYLQVISKKEIKKLTNRSSGWHTAPADLVL